MKKKDCLLATLGLALAFSFAGCTPFQPHPISASGMADAFGSRTLDRPELHAYLATNGVAVTDPRMCWSLSSLTLAAFFYHPDLAVARAQMEIAQGEAEQAAERPNPTFNVAPGYNTTRNSGVPSYWLADVALSIPIETAGKRGRRVAQCRQLTQAARMNIAQTAWQIRMGVHKSLLSLYSARETEKTTDELLEIRKEIAALTTAQSEAGELSKTEAARDRIQEDAARIAQLRAQHESASQRVALAAAIGVPAHALSGITFDFCDVCEPPTHLPSAEIRRSSLLARADLLSSLAEYEAAQCALQLEIAKQYPDLDLGPAYQYDQGDNKWAFGLTFTLPIFSRNRGAILAADARRKELAAKCEALQARVIGEVERAETSYINAVGRKHAATALKEQLERNWMTAETVHKTGATTRLDLLTERLELVTAELACIAANTDACRAWEELEDAMQMPCDLKDWMPCVSQTTVAGEKKHE